MKKLFIAFAAALLLLTTLAPAAMAAAQSTPESAYIEILGTVAQVNAGEGWILVNKAQGGQLQLNVDKSTCLLNNADAKPMKLSAIKVGSTIRAWHDEATTMSIPAQSYCRVLVGNIKDADQVTGDLFRVESVTATANGYELMNAEGDLIYTLAKNAKVRRYKDGRSVKASSIGSGDLIVVWYGQSAASYPAQANGKLAAVLKSASSNGSVSLGTNSGVVSVNGKKLKLAAFSLDNTYMTPLRETATKLGFRCKWNKDTQTMTLSGKGCTASFTYDDPVATINGAGYTLTAPQMAHDALFVDVQAFKLLGCGVALNAN